jgi:hypothetical protein
VPDGQQIVTVRQATTEPILTNAHQKTFGLHSLCLRSHFRGTETKIDQQPTVRTSRGSRELRTKQQFAKRQQHRVTLADAHALEFVPRRFRAERREQGERALSRCLKLPGLPHAQYFFGGQPLHSEFFKSPEW